MCPGQKCDIILITRGLVARLGNTEYSLEIHLLEPNNIPLPGLRIERHVRARSLATTDEPGLDVTTGHWARQAVLTRIDREVGQRELPAIAGGDGGRAY